MINIAFPLNYRSKISPGGGTGRRAGLKILSGLYLGAGSIPAPGTYKIRNGVRVPNKKFGIGVGAKSATGVPRCPDEIGIRWSLSRYKREPRAHFNLNFYILIFNI